VGVADLADLDEGTQREVADLGQVLLDQVKCVGLDLGRQLGLEVGVGDEVCHTLQLLVGVHGQVDAERAGTHGLVERSQREIANEDNAALEFKRGGQVGALDFGLPADDALGVGVECRLQQIDRRRILEDGIAVVEDDDPILVFVQRAVQRVGRGVALDHDVLLGRRDVDRLGFEGVHEAGFVQDFGDGVGLADTAFARNDGGRRLAFRDHFGEGFGEGEAVGDREGETLGDLFARDFLERGEVLLKQAIGALGGLGLGDHLTVGHGDILARGAVERDRGLDRLRLSHDGLLGGGGLSGALGGGLGHRYLLVSDHVVSIA